MKKILIILFAVMMTPVFAENNPDFTEILGQVDFRGSFLSTDFSATFTMITEDPETGVSKRQVTQFRRDSDELFLMLTLAPENKKGQGSLKIENHIWRYDPDSRKFTHMTLEEKYEETAARNSDFRHSTMAEDYDVISYTSEKLGKYSVWKVDLKSKDDSVTYPYQVVYIDQKREVILKQEEYSLSNRLVRSIYSPSYAKIDQKYVATKKIMVDELVEGKKTTMTITDISVGKLPDEVFTKSYLERVSR